MFAAILQLVSLEFRTPRWAWRGTFAKSSICVGNTMICMYTCITQANDYNVKISWEEEGEEALGTMGLTLLSTRMAHEAVSSYRAPSLQS